MYPRSMVSLVLVLAAAPLAHAQPLGTFKWQLQPYCNVVTVNVTGVAGVYTVEGYDDQCGAPNRAPLTGVGTPNPDGTIGFGLHVVTAPGGRGVQIDARITLAALSGPWTDSDGLSGTFAFGTSTGGNPRPLPVLPPPVVPPSITLQTDGGLVAGGVFGKGTIPAEGPGPRMMWHPAKAAFRAGVVGGTEWDDAEVGAYSAAFGLAVSAPGSASFAAGTLSRATGEFTAAFGYASQAHGSASFAAGTSARAVGKNSVAIGGERTFQGVLGVLASGASAIALGAGHDAAGVGSVALGTRATTTAGATGSFVYGDRSSPNQVQSFAPNEFLVRAAGGTYIYSNASLSTGVKLAPSANAWSSLSDVNSKEHFRDLDGIDVLAKLAQMPIREWNYKAQDTAIRHVGPTAQDFHAAFGLGEDPLRISTIDADGIALAGVKALALENQSLKAELAALRGRLERLEGAMNEPTAGAEIGSRK